MSIAIVALKVNIVLPDEVANQKVYDKLRRIDFLGSLALAGAVGCSLLAVSLKTAEEMPWSHPLILALFVISAICFCLFIQVEKNWAAYPVMPLHLTTQRIPLAVSVSNLFGSVSAFSMVCGISSLPRILTSVVFQIYNIPLVC
jgi:hypothetical protein